MDEEAKTPTPPTARTWQINAIIALLALLIAVSLIQSYQPETNWEYKVGSIPDTDLSETMNRLGGEGWELVFARRASSNIENVKPDFKYEMIFRRPVKGSSFSLTKFF